MGAVHQVSLSQGTRRLTCWIEKRPAVRKGVDVSLKGKDGRWRIDAVYSPVLEAEDINRRWAVGGLF